VKSILDPSFRYTRSFETDLRKTFERIRGEQRKHEAAPDPLVAGPKLSLFCKQAPQSSTEAASPRRHHA
jgi:hypothetical protein